MTPLATPTTATSVTNGSNSGGALSASVGYPCNHGMQGRCTLCSGYGYASSAPYCIIHGYYYNSFTCPSCQACTCSTISSAPCPVHAFTTTQGSGTIPITNWPLQPPQVDLHAKEGHRISHEQVVDEKGLKIVFKCSFCNEVIYKKYIVKIPRKIREEKCLVRILNHK